MHKIHLIGNAHLDPVWLWRWQEGYSEVLATFRSALDRIKEFDDFIFTSAAAIYYEWIEETDPEMFSEIKQRVKEGKWAIVGGWLIQPDCNAPCGESFARHSLYGQNYFKEKFGVTAKVGYNVDSFGHSATLPQILKKSGMDAYIFMRPNQWEKEYEFKKNTFMWVSPDGTKIKTYRIPEPYCSLLNESHELKILRETEQADEQGEDLMSFYGVGNHGGGPTIKTILLIKDLMKKYEGRYAFSSPEKFFETVNEEVLPEYSGDLFHHASGCYTAVMKIKSLNRQSEASLLNAEKSGVMAVLAGVKKNTENLKDAWKPTLFNHFHDIMCGCCIKEAVEDAVNAFGSSITAANISQNKALQAIAWNIDTSKQLPVILGKEDFKLWERENAGTPFIVFNPNSFEVTAPVRLGALVKSVEDDEGNLITSQKVRASMTNASYVGVDNWETEILATVPAMGWKLYWIYRTREAEVAALTPKYTPSKNLIENDSVKVSISDEGYIESIFDKTEGKEMLKDKIVPLVLDETDYDTWAHVKFEFNNVIGNFVLDEIADVKQGELKQEIRIKYKYEKSELIADITLYNDFKEVFFDFKVNWQEKHKILKLSVPTVLENAKEMVSEPYGFNERNADGKEHPMQKWLALKNDEYSIGVATDTRSAYDFKEGTLRITALRSPIYADHFGTRDQYCEFTEQGEQKFKLAISGGCDDVAKLYKLSETMLSPLPTILGTYHKGKLGSVYSAVNVSADNVVITAFKGAEDGRGYIIHAHEIAGRNAECEIKVDALGIDFKTHFNPQEIKVFRIFEGNVTETDFLE